MSWTCTACEFAGNEDNQEACMTCGSDKIEEDQETTSESASAEDNLGPEVVVIELPPNEKLGVKIIPPVDGVIDRGLAIDYIDNPLLENKVQTEDLIVAIGGQNVDGMGFSDAIDLIRNMPRPLAINFEIDQVRRQQVAREKLQQNDLDNDLDSQLTPYTVVFDNGPIGLNLEEAVRYGIDGAVVRALKGQAKTSGMISIGDIVYMVNEMDVLFLPYLEVMNVLRNAMAPKTLQFVPKDKLAKVQRVNLRHSESFWLRESTSRVKQKLMKNPRIVKGNGNDGDDNQSIAQLILDNQAAYIKKGRLYKQGRVMRNWKSRYFVLSVSKVEYFKNPSSTTSRGEMSFLNHRCTVRSLPGTGEVVCRSPNVTAEYLLELRVDDRRMVMACTTESDKNGWMDAVKLAIDASKTVNRTQNLGESLREVKALRTQRTESISMDGTFMDRNAGGRLSQFNYEAFPTPVVHVGVLSATNLTKPGGSVNTTCEVTVGAETFKTSVVKSQRSPVWKQDNSASFEAPSDDMVVEIRIFDERLFATELMATLTIPLRSLPNMQKTTKNYPLALGSRSVGAVLTLVLEYVNKQKAFEEDQERAHLDDDMNGNGMMNERDETDKLKAEAQMAADEATHHAARAQEEAHMLLEQSRQKAEAVMAAARDEQREGKAALEKAMTEAARAKEEAEKQLTEARRAQEEAQKLIEANRRIQESDVQEQSIFTEYGYLVQNRRETSHVKDQMEVYDENPNKHEESPKASTENYDLSMDLFVNLFEMCEQMEETRGMCESVLVRLQKIQTSIVEQTDTMSRGVVREFAAIRTRFRTFLMKYQHGTAFERLVSARTVVGLLRAFHVAIDSLETQISGEIRGDQLNWMEAWERGKQEVEAHLIRLWKTNAISVLDALPDQKAQENALLLLSRETGSNLDTYSVESNELLSSVRQRIIRQSAASVPVVPGWFIPDHEVQREQSHFAHGSFGKVYRGTWRNEKVVIKCVEVVSASDERDFSREARVWLRAQHPNVVRFFGACHLTRPWFFVCEEVTKGNLADFLSKNKGCGRALTWRLLRDTALGLRCLHQNGIVHCDLKCNQILVTEDLTAKLTDFGMSFVSMESRPATTSGAVRWKAPELLSSEGHAPNCASDVYSFGMCVVEAISGRIPWRDVPDIAVIYHLTRGTFISRPKAFVNDDEWDFVLSLCSFDPSKRLGLDAAIEQMEQFARQEELNAAGG